MSYIGKEPQFTQYPSKFFNGDGTAMTVSLDYAPPNAAALLVFIDGVRQDTSAYTLSGTSLTFTGTVPSGTNNVQVVHLGLTQDVGVPSDDTISTDKLQDDSVTSAKLDTNIAIDGDLTVDTDTLYVDSTNNKVGIGTDSPSDASNHPDAKLMVKGGISFNELTTASEGSLPAITQWSRDGAAQDLVIGTRSGTGVLLFYTGNAGSGGDWGDSSNAERMRIDSSGNLQFDSGYGSTATAYGCRAWVNFNGTGTVAIRDSGNVSSITDNGTGNYTVNFTIAMPDSNYSATATAGNGDSSTTAASAATTFRSTGSVRVYTANSNTSTAMDRADISSAIFR